MNLQEEKALWTELAIIDSAVIKILSIMLWDTMNISRNSTKLIPGKILLNCLKR